MDTQSAVSSATTCLVFVMELPVEVTSRVKRDDIDLIANAAGGPASD